MILILKWSIPTMKGVEVALVTLNKALSTYTHFRPEYRDTWKFAWKSKAQEGCAIRDNTFADDKN